MSARRTPHACESSHRSWCARAVQFVNPIGACSGNVSRRFAKTRVVCFPESVLMSLLFSVAPAGLTFAGDVELRLCSDTTEPVRWKINSCVLRYARANARTQSARTRVCIIYPGICSVERPMAPDIYPASICIGNHRRNSSFLSLGLIQRQGIEVTLHFLLISILRSRRRRAVDGDRHYLERGCGCGHERERKRLQWWQVIVLIRTCHFASCDVRT